MKKSIVAVFFLFVIASAFGREKIETKVFETSNDFEEIWEAFQKRLYNASSDFKYFNHHVEVISPFDVDGTEGGLFDRKAKIAIRKKSTSFLK